MEGKLTQCLSAPVSIHSLASSRIERTKSCPLGLMFLKIASLHVFQSHQRKLIIVSVILKRGLFSVQYDDAVMEILCSAEVQDIRLVGSALQTLDV
jgi:hypothetical protein